MSARVNDSVPTKYEGGDFSYHKPDIPSLGRLVTTAMQKFPSKPFFSKCKKISSLLFHDPNSPVKTEETNSDEAAMRPLSLSRNYFPKNLQEA
jgi:hypothetical protein